MTKLPATIAHIRVLHQSFYEKVLVGEISAGGYQWEFTWFFGKGELVVQPYLGSALVYDALMRFLVKSDYDLEAGADYDFTIRAKF